MKHQTDVNSLNFLKEKKQLKLWFVIGVTIIYNLAVPAYLLMSFKQHKALFINYHYLTVHVVSIIVQTAIIHEASSAAKQESAIHQLLTANKESRSV